MLIVSSTDFMSHFLKYHPRKLISLGKNHSLFTRDVRDRDQKNYTLPGPGPKKNYRDHDRDQIKRVIETWTGTGAKKSWSRTSLVGKEGIQLSCFL
jgi:hypothetical protein